MSRAAILRDRPTLSPCFSLTGGGRWELVLFKGAAQGGAFCRVTVTLRCRASGGWLGALGCLATLARAGLSPSRCCRARDRDART